MTNPSPKKPAKIQPPTGTRDVYPQDMLLRRYITDAWRRAALRHGFDEIDGPTFESAELYKVKSGEGILGEMFGVYSGKSPEDVESVKRGEPPYGLRPEFTPTLARMYAARAKQLPQPCKWFCVSNFFRAERPQRGRLREFFQWNCDVIGGEDPAGADAEVIGTIVACAGDMGLTSADCCARVWSRAMADAEMEGQGIDASMFDAARVVVDQRAKQPREALIALAASRGFTPAQQVFLAGGATNNAPGIDAPGAPDLLQSLMQAVSGAGIEAWVTRDPSIARGLAYYTGTVFEVIAQGERAVAGGGRYDNLIELFGGPPTPACGFGMGDVVLGNLLGDRGLIPEGRDMLEALSRPMPVRPDVFVIPSPNPGCEDAVAPLVALLRRGVETPRYAQSQTSGDAGARLKPWSRERYDPGAGGVPPMHVRRSYRSTRNVGKLMADASGCHARFAVIIEECSPPADGKGGGEGSLEGVATIKDLDRNEALGDRAPLKDVGRLIAQATAAQGA